MQRKETICFDFKLFLEFFIPIPGRHWNCRLKYRFIFVVCNIDRNISLCTVYTTDPHSDASSEND